MKKVRRIAALTAVLLLLPGLFVPTISVMAAEGEGLVFAESDLYRPSKTYDAAPNTFEAWVKLPTSAAADRGGVILGNYGLAKSIINFEIHSNGKPRLFWTESNGNNSDWIFTNVNVCTGEWLHVGIVRDVNAGQVHCYINGVLKQSLPIAADRGRENTIPAGGLYIGGDGRGGNSQYFKGAIREIAVFSNVRNETQISQDMRFVSADTSLLAHYDLAQHKRGTDITDQSGKGCNAKYIYNAANIIWIDPEDKAPVTDYAYSFAVVGDTQVISDKHPDKFKGIYDWILDNIEEKNIKFVFGLGDITERSTKAEWTRAQEAIHSLDGKVEYSLVRGNHDTLGPYKNAFPWSEYKDKFIGSFDNSMVNTYRTLTIGKVKYLLITLDYGPSDAVLAWAGDLCEQYPDHNVIITTHAYLYRDGTTLDARDACPPATSGGYNNGDHMWDKLVSKHANIVLVMSGHDPCEQIVVAQDKGEKGNVVTQMLIDPQGADAQLGGLGMVAMLYFSEDGRDVTVEYYSTIKEKFFYGVNQFTMTLDLVDENTPGKVPTTTKNNTSTTGNTSESTTGDPQNNTTETNKTLTDPTNGNVSATPEEKGSPVGGIILAIALVLVAAAVVVADVFLVRKKLLAK